MGLRILWFVGPLETVLQMHTRRQFNRLAVLASCTPLLARAQPVQGTHFRVVSPRQPTRDPQRIEVVEFFAYACHHCHDLEPFIDAWQKKLPADVSFRRIPVAFRAELVVHNALYFALESMDLVDKLHAKVFEAVHASKSGLKSPQEITAFLQANGVAPEPVIQAMGSFTAVARRKQAVELAAGYGVEGTPTLGVDGRWTTDGAMAGSNRASLAVADYLIGLARQTR